MAAPTQWYVDPSINANSGSGTSAIPFGDLQWAFNAVGTSPGRDATNGDQFNIIGGTAEIITGSLSLATYGTPTETTPVIFRGCTSAAGDGGMGEIDCGGNPMFASARTYIILADLKMHNFGNNHGVDLTGGYCVTYRCEFHKGASTPSGKYLLNSALSNMHFGCYFHDAGTNGQAVQSGRLYYGCYFYNCVYGIVLAQHSIGNLFVDCANAIYLSGDLLTAISNTVYSSTANTGTGILLGSTAATNWCLAINNIIEGYSGTGGKAIAGAGDTSILGYNAFYNNATPKSMADVWLDLGGDQTLSASAFNNPASGDFSLKTTSAAVEVAWQTTWFGPASTIGKPDMGAVQNGAGSSSGGAVRISPAKRISL